MNRVSLVSVNEYQYSMLVLDYRNLIRDGWDTEGERYAARMKWGLDSDGGQLAYREALVHEGEL